MSSGENEQIQAVGTCIDGNNAWICQKIFKTKLKS